MKALIIYDSQYGNTEQIAQAIGKGFTGDVKVVKVGDVKPEDIAHYYQIIIGSPTQGGRTTVAIKTFMDNLTAEDLKGKRLAAFDTRLKSLWVKVFGWAANKIEDTLKAKGGNSVAQPQGFFVKSAKGPLVDGELERATTWAKAIAAGVPTAQMQGDFGMKTKE